MDEDSLDYRSVNVFIDHVLSQWGPSSSSRVVANAQDSSTNCPPPWPGNTRAREIETYRKTGAHDVNNTTLPSLSASNFSTFTSLTLSLIGCGLGSIDLRSGF